MDKLANRYSQDLFWYVYHQVLPQYHISRKWHAGQDAGSLHRISRSWPRRTGLPIRQLAERTIVEYTMTKTGTVEKRKDGVVCTHLINMNRIIFLQRKKQGQREFPLSYPVFMRCYFTAIFTLSLPILATTMVPRLAENKTLPSIDFAVPRAFPSRA